MSTRPGETLAAMEEMSEGAPAPVEVLPEEPEDPEPEEEPLPEDPEPKGEEPLPDEPEPKGEEPVAPPEPTEGLVAEEVVADEGHTA
jgi:hypothetical protein